MAVSRHQERQSIPRLEGQGRFIGGKVSSFGCFVLNNAATHNYRI
jgi:hypothetical protein